MIEELPLFYVRFRAVFPDGDILRTVYHLVIYRVFQKDLNREWRNIPERADYVAYATTGA